MNMFRNGRGFTLIELMVTVAIVSILLALALPNYSSKAKKSRRSDAYTAIEQVTAAQERYFATRHAYANFADPFNSTVALTSPQGLYSVTVTGVSAATPMNYTVTATPVAGQAQASDTECTSMSKTNTGTRTSAGSRATDLDCWR
jgi:type IV pilus assembly protein PilE